MCVLNARWPTCNRQASGCLRCRAEPCQNFIDQGPIFGDRAPRYPATGQRARAAHSLPRSRVSLVPDVAGVRREMGISDPVSRSRPLSVPVGTLPVPRDRAARRISTPPRDDRVAERHPARRSPHPNSTASPRSATMAGTSCIAGLCPPAAKLPAALSPYHCSQLPTRARSGTLPVCTTFPSTTTPGVLITP